MKSSFWTPYISDHAINVICWTLIHSLWIGLIIALLSGLVISITTEVECSVALQFALWRPCAVHLVSRYNILY